MEDDTQGTSAATLEALEALSVTIESLALPGGGFNRSLHEQHIELSRLAGMEDQEEVAKLGLVKSLACGDDIWAPILAGSVGKANLESVEDVKTLLELHEASVEDYLSIPLLAGRAQFAINLWNGVYPPPQAENEEGDDETEGSSGSLIIESAEMKEWLTTEVVREVLQDCIFRANADLSLSHEVWDKARDWELSLLKTVYASDVPAQLPHVHKFFLDRLRTPHATADDSFQKYTEVVSKYCEAEYESLLVDASKAKADGLGKFSKRERWETRLMTDPQSRLAVYPAYVAWELKPKKPDGVRVQAVYARAIADAALVGDVTTLETFWLSYITYLNKNLRIELIMRQEVFRAIRSCPFSGEIWAWYVKCLERFVKPVEDIDDIYRSAIASEQLSVRDGGVEDLIKVVMARLSYERRRVEENEVDSSSFVDLSLEASETVKLAVKGGDPSFRTEKYLVSWLERFGQLDEAASIWEGLSKTHSTSYLVWIGWSEFETRRPAVPRARTVFEKALRKPAALDWPEAVFSAYLAFEEMYGSLDTLDQARESVETAQTAVAAKRHKDAMAAAKAAGDTQPYEAVAAVAPTEPGESMNVDTSVEESAEASSSGAGQKRKAEEDLAENEAKKAKPDAPAPSAGVALVRDRENTTVFVSRLPAEATEEDLTKMFKDCGRIREIKISPRADGLVVATVEFFERESVPAALTKDKKRLNEAEIEVSIAWQSTLYVTNFPESADDAYIRNLFEPFGAIHETRWPGKKFKGTRRFVYVQFLSPSSAQASLSLNGKELGPERVLSVAISNPSRKKERTDAKASDKEVVVSQMSKFVNKKDLERLFKPFGAIKDIRMNLDEEGHVRGAAFIEFEEESAAKAALSMNNQEFKKRRIAVTVPDQRAKVQNKFALDRCVRVGGLPAGLQEALLQQAFEKVSPVSRVSVIEKFNEAIVELESEDAVGKILLSHNPFPFEGVTLPIIAGTQRFPPKTAHAPPPVNATAGSSSAAGTSSSTDFTPSTLFRPAPRPKSTKGRIGLGAERKRPAASLGGPGTTFAKAGDGSTAGASSGGDVEMGGGTVKKDQNAFRAMLAEKK